MYADVYGEVKFGSVLAWCIIYTQGHILSDDTAMLNECSSYIFFSVARETIFAGVRPLFSHESHG